jgi:hypothetical protein
MRLASEVLKREKRDILDEPENPDIETRKAS